MLEEIPGDPGLERWIRLAGERISFQGLPARICWAGYGERQRLGLRFNEMVRSGELKGPIVIGRDHLDSGSVASPYRETESMADGSDAIADWPLLNALLNTSAGASWVSIHHGGGVGIGRSIHAGMVCLADGSELAAKKLERVLTADPGSGVIRHADAGYERARAGRGGARRPDPDGGETGECRWRFVRSSRSATRCCASAPVRSRSPRSPETDVQSLIDDMVETMRAAGGAGLAANQIGERARVAVAEVRGSNPRYPYKPPIPLTVMINPEVEALGEETLLINEGCLSIPDLRGDVKRHIEIRVRYLDRSGEHA